MKTNSDDLCSTMKHFVCLFYNSERHSVRTLQYKEALFVCSVQYKEALLLCLSVFTGTVYVLYTTKWLCV